MTSRPLRWSATTAALSVTWAMLAASVSAHAGEVPPTGPTDNSSGTVAAPYDPLDPIIDNGSLIQLGVQPQGHLNVPGGTLSMPSASTTNVGLRFLPTNGEATAPGCLCEGWGIANADTSTGTFAGYANVAVDGVRNLSLEAGTGLYSGPEAKARPESVGTRFKSIVASPATAPRVRVTHDFHPTSSTNNLYEVDVSVENTGTTAIGDLRYRRVMDWDIAPNTFSEFVETHVGTSDSLVRASNNGFASANPLSPAGGTQLLSGSPDYVGGPTDQGALFDFKFGELAAGETRSFKIYYGAADTRANALAAVASVGGEMYSLGLPRVGSAMSTTGPHAFVFAFKGVGGTPIPPTNTPPSVSAGGTYSDDEGTGVALSGAVSDVDPGDTVTSSWAAEGGAPCTFTDPASAATTMTCTDDGVFSLTLTATDGTTTTTDTTTATIANVAPSITAVSASSAGPAPLGTAVTLTAPFTDPGSSDTHTCSVDWGDTTTSPGTVSSGSCEATKTYATPGLYAATVTVTDDDGGADSKAYEYVVVYDPNGGFVTGGGWIESPVGACTLDTTCRDASGKANFGFVSKYQKGATVPTGNTAFQFHAGNLALKSTAYEWLTVSGSKAQYKGTGTINGTGDYGFLLTATDGQVTGGGGTDKFRIKIWDRASGTTVYDNQGGLDNADAAQALAGGSIVIHSAK